MDTEVKPIVEVMTTLVELCPDTKFAEHANTSLRCFSIFLGIINVPEVRWSKSPLDSTFSWIGISSESNRFKQTLNFGYRAAIAIDKLNCCEWPDIVIDVYAELMASYLLFLAYGVKISCSYLEWVEPAPFILSPRKKWGKGKLALVEVLTQNPALLHSPSDLAEFRFGNLRKRAKAFSLPEGFEQSLKKVFAQIQSAPQPDSK